LSANAPVLWLKGAKGLPVLRDMYARWFRRIARVAGIPDV
jgi:hypothetical protein